MLERKFNWNQQLEYKINLQIRIQNFSYTFKNLDGQKLLKCDPKFSIGCVPLFPMLE